MAEILTPEEVAALTAAFAADAPSMERPLPGAVRPIDLANQERSLEGRMPGLDLVVGRFGRGVRNVLAGCFGDVPNVRTASVGLVRFARLAPLLVEPAALVRFRLAPLRGQGILTIPPPLLAAMLQAACGGPAGSAVALPLREFTPVELTLIERFASRVLAELRTAWAPMADVDCTPVQVDAVPLLAAVAAPEDLVVHAELTIVVAGLASSTLGLVVPNAALDPVRTRLERMRPGDDGAPASADAAWTGALHAQLLDVPADVVVELGTTRLTLSRLVALAAGDLLTLDTGRDGPAIVRVAGAPKFVGVPGIQNGNNAVRITDPA